METWKMCYCTVSFPLYAWDENQRSQSLIVDPAREASHNELLYLPRLFSQKHYTRKQQATETRSGIKKKQFILLSRRGSSFFWLLGATSQNAIFHPATSPVLQAARWQIDPVGLLWVLCLQMARWCWWGTLVYWDVQEEGLTERE